jgi:hypothetical protein
MPLTKDDLLQIRLIVKEEVSDIRADVASINTTLNIHDQRLTRVEENTAISRKILEKNELTEKSTHGRRLYRVESRIHKMGVVATTGSK